MGWRVEKRGKEIDAGMQVAKAEKTRVLWDAREKYGEAEEER